MCLIVHVAYFGVCLLFYHMCWLFTMHLCYLGFWFHLRLSERLSMFMFLFSLVEFLMLHLMNGSCWSAMVKCSLCRTDVPWCYSYNDPDTDERLLLCCDCYRSNNDFEDWWGKQKNKYDGVSHRYDFMIVFLGVAHESFVTQKLLHFPHSEFVCIMSRPPSIPLYVEGFVSEAEYELVVGDCLNCGKRTGSWCDGVSGTCCAPKKWHKGLQKPMRTSPLCNGWCAYWYEKWHYWWKMDWCQPRPASWSPEAGSVYQ